MSAILEHIDDILERAPSAVFVLGGIAVDGVLSVYAVTAHANANEVSFAAPFAVGAIAIIHGIGEIISNDL